MLDRQTGQYVASAQRELESPEDTADANITCVSFSSDSGKLVTGSTDTSVYVWVYRNGLWQYLQRLVSHNRPITEVVARRNHMISAGGEDQTVRVWTLSNVDQTYIYQPQVIQTNDTVPTADLS